MLTLVFKKGRRDTHIKCIDTRSYIHIYTHRKLVKMVDSSREARRFKEAKVNKQNDQAIKPNFTKTKTHRHPTPDGTH